MTHARKRSILLGQIKSKGNEWGMSYFLAHSIDHNLEIRHLIKLIATIKRKGA